MPGRAQVPRVHRRPQHPPRRERHTFISAIPSLRLRTPWKTELEDVITYQHGGMALVVCLVLPCHRVSVGWAPVIWFFFVVRRP
jgi:hypothetical protein